MYNPGKEFYKIRRLFHHEEIRRFASLLPADAVLRGRAGRVRRRPVCGRGEHVSRGAAGEGARRGGHLRRLRQHQPHCHRRGGLRRAARYHHRGQQPQGFRDLHQALHGDQGRRQGRGHGHDPGRRFAAEPGAGHRLPRQLRARLRQGCRRRGRPQPADPAVHQQGLHLEQPRRECAGDHQRLAADRAAVQGQHHLQNARQRAGQHELPGHADQ